MAVLLVIILLLLPADPRTAFHSVFQILAALAFLWLLVAPRRRILPALKLPRIGRRIRSARDFLIDNDEEEQEPPSQDASKPGQPGDNEVSTEWVRPALSWTVLGLVIVSLLNLFNWIDVPRSVAGVRTIAGLALLWFYCAWDSRHRTWSLVLAAATGAFLIQAVLTVSGAFSWDQSPLGSELATLFERPSWDGQSLAFPTALFGTIVLLPAVLGWGAGSMARGFMTHRTLNWGVTTALGFTVIGIIFFFVCSLANPSAVLLGMLLPLVSAIVGLLLSPASFRWTGALAAASVALAVGALVLLHAEPAYRGIFHDLTWQAPDGPAVTTAVLWDAIPWGVGLENMTIAARATASEAGGSMAWGAGWMRSLGNLGILVLLWLAGMGALLYLTRHREGPGPGVRGIVYAALAGLVVAGAVAGIDSILTTPLLWLLVALLVSAMPGRSSAVPPLSLKIGFGTLAAFLVLFTVLSEVSDSLDSPPPELTKSAPPESLETRFAWAAAIAPWRTEPHLSLYELLHSQSATADGAELRAGLMLEAQQHLEDAAARSPYNSRIHLNLAAGADAQSRPDARLLHLERARDVDPRNPMVVAALADALADMQRDTRALELLRHWANLQPDSAEPHVRMGQILENQDRFNEARAEYRLALRLHYLNAEARAGLARLSEAAPGPDDSLPPSGQPSLPEADRAFGP